jgi:hypothetical protein
LIKNVFCSTPIQNVNDASNNYIILKSLFKMTQPVVVIVVVADVVVAVAETSFWA